MTEIETAFLNRVSNCRCDTVSMDSSASSNDLTSNTAWALSINDRPRAAHSPEDAQVKPWTPGDQALTTQSTQ